MMEFVDNDRNISFSDLMNYENDVFLQKAYLAVLGRSADESGLMHWKKRMDKGLTKIEVLSQLYYSNEAGNTTETKLKKSARYYQDGERSFLLNPLYSVWKYLCVLSGKNEDIKMAVRSREIYNELKNVSLSVRGNRN